MRNFFRSFGSRFIALFLLTLVPVMITGYVVLYFYMIPVIDSDGEAQITEELVQLHDEFDLNGSDGLAHVISRRITQSINNRTVYLLRGPDGKELAGNITSEPQIYALGQRAVTLDIIPYDQVVPHPYIARTSILPGGYRLTIGKETRARAAFQSTIVLGIATSLAVAFIVGVFWQSSVEHYTRQRVAEFTQTATEIVRGNLTKRFPFKDGRDEFDELSLAVNGVIDRLEDLVSQLRAVTDAIAHDFRSPLARVRSRLDSSMGSDATFETLQQSQDDAQKEIDRMLGTLNSLLEIARVEAGIGREQMTEVDIGEILRDVGDTFEPIAEEKGVSIAIHATRQIPVTAHKALLTQAVINLVDNAIKFSAAGDTVTLEAATGPGYPSIVVSDHGPGIPPDDIAKVTARFVRLNPARPKGGSGLGLSLVAAVAKFHGATLELKDNQPGLRAVLRFVTPGRRRS